MSSLAREVLGITDRQNVPAAIAEAYETLTGTPLTRKAFMQLGSVAMSEVESSFTDTERLVDLDTVVAILEGGKLFANTLVDWPIYQRMMRNYGVKARA